MFVAVFEWRALFGVRRYMKGRLTVDKMAAALEELQAIIDSKYSILSMPVAKMNEKHMRRYKAYKDQENKETRGLYFFADSDLAEAKHVRTDASGKAILTVLRHLGRLRNARGAASRYIVC